MKHGLFLFACMALSLGCPRSNDAKRDTGVADTDSPPSADAISTDLGTSPDSASKTPEAAVASDAAVSPDLATQWHAVESLLVTRSAEASATNLGLSIWDQHDRLAYQHMLGSFTPDTRVAVASASKLVSGLVLFDVIRRGHLTLDSTTGQVLGWTGENAAITLRHLLSFTSGLPREAPCTLIALTTTAACTEKIAAATMVAPPGTQFDYGSTHLHVAARMAEVASARSWTELYDEILRIPFGLPAEATYYTQPRQADGTTNPLIAGGLRASMNDYRNFLSLAFHKGIFGSTTLGTTALFDEQAKEPFPNVVIGSTPLPAYRYGLASWLLCTTPATGCASLSSPGAFGFTPWYDREAGYYAILGMELPRDGADDGVAAFAVDLMQELQPLIRSTLTLQ